MAYRLVAHGIGGRTVRELNEGPDANRGGMDVEEFLTWAAYTTIEPFHADRADAHTAMIMAQQFNMNRSKGKAAKRPKDFYPKWHKPPKREMSLEELERAMKLHYLAMDGDPESIS